MYSKLALRNVKKSFRDYAIYFITLMFGVCIFYVFNSIDAQKSMMVITESTLKSMETLQSIMSYFSVFVAVVLGFLIVYANRFLVKRRKKELGIYQILGMEKGHISQILTIETLLVAILSLAVGLALGVLLSQGFAVLTASLFEVKLAEFKFVFSSAAALKAIMYFGIAFLLVLIFNRITIGRQKLIDLLHAERKNEKFKTPYLMISVIIFIISLACLGIAYHLIVKSGTRMNDGILLTSIALGIIGTFLFFFSLSGFFLKIIQQMKGVYFKGLNMFVLRQINSKINTAYVSITIVCLMLFLAICGLSFGMGFSKTLTADMERLNPYDATWGISMWDMNDEIVGIDIDFIDEFNRTGIETSSYAKSMSAVTVYNAPAEINHAISDYSIFIKLSDYNKLIEMQGKTPAVLANDEFIMNCLDKDHQKEYTEYFSENKLNLSDTDLTLKNIDETILYNGYAIGNYPRIYILPDKFLKDAEINYHIITVNYIEPNHKYNDLYKTAQQEVFDSLQKKAQIVTNNIGMYTNNLTKIDNFEESKSSSVTIAYLAVYLGVIFSVMAATVLAITQLSEASDNTQRYTLLRKLGADNKMINKALLSQIAIYFGVPLLLAIVHSIVGINFINQLISQLGRASILRDSLITAGIIITIYSGYFLATYFGSKRIIGNK